MAISLNAISYNGSPAAPTNPFPPDADGVARTDTKIGKTLPAASGLRNFVSRNARKPTWKLKWTKANATTRNAVKAVAELNTTFVFVDQAGVSWTVQCEEDDAYSESTAFTTHTNVSLYNLDLTFHLAT
jgi:hypothetical protein